MTDDSVLIEPPVGADEVSALVGALERQRRTFRWKADGLDRAGLSTSVGASTVTIGGLLKHLAFVESYYFALRLHGRSPGAPWDAVDWDAQPDWDWRSAADDDPAVLYSLWDEAVARSRGLLTEAIAEGGLDRPVGEPLPDGSQPNLRNVMVDLVEEYARHTGHADLIRESIDGRTGEDAPRDW